MTKFEVSLGSYTQAAWPTRNGWVVEVRNREHGPRWTQRVLVPYSDRFPRGADLAELGDDLFRFGATMPGAVLVKPGVSRLPKGALLA